MFSIKFEAPESDERVSVEISIPPGTDSGFYHVYIDRFFCGTITKRSGEWRQLHINKHEFTIDDIQALGERIDEELNKKSPVDEHGL